MIDMPYKQSAFLLYLVHARIPREKENLLNLHSKNIANMPRIPPPPGKHNNPSEPSWKNVLDPRRWPYVYNYKHPIKIVYIDISNFKTKYAMGQISDNLIFYLSLTLLKRAHSGKRETEIKSQSCMTSGLKCHPICKLCNIILTEG